MVFFVTSNAAAASVAFANVPRGVTIFRLHRHGVNCFGRRRWWLAFTRLSWPRQVVIFWAVVT